MNNEHQTVGLGLTWEKLSLGRKFRNVGRTITKADLVNFIDPTGLVRTRNSIVNQDGRVCIEYTPLRMLRGLGMLGGS